MPTTAIHAAAHTNTVRQSSAVTPSLSLASHCAAEISQSRFKSVSSVPEGAACLAAS